MKIALLEIKDEVNVRIKNVDETVMNDAVNALSFYAPNYRFSPSFKLGRWKGKINLLHKTGKTYLNLLPDVASIFEKAGYQFSIDDKRKNHNDIQSRLIYPTEDMFSEFKIKGEPVYVRDYQLKAAIKALQEEKGILELATNAGKTLTCAAICNAFKNIGNSIVIVPNIDLVIQTQAFFNNLGLNAGMWYGDAKDRRQITISTWQSLVNHPEVFNDVYCLIGDEAHQQKSEIISNVLNEAGANVPFRFGCTGTVPKEDLYRYQLLANFGPVLITMSSWELQQRGVSSQSQIYQKILLDTKNPDYLNSIAFSIDNDEPIADFKQQIDILFSNDVRNDYIANQITEITKNNNNTLVLVGYREIGKMLESKIENSISLDGRDDSDYRKEIYDKFDKSDNNVLIATYGIASTGIDINRIFNLILIEPGKKYERTIQSIGRGLRKGSDKDFINIYDYCSDDMFSKNHSKTRLKYYKEARHKVEIEKIDYYKLRNE